MTLHNDIIISIIPITIISLWHLEISISSPTFSHIFFFVFFPMFWPRPFKGLLVIAELSPTFLRPRGEREARRGALRAANLGHQRADYQGPLMAADGRWGDGMG